MANATKRRPRRPQKRTQAPQDAQDAVRGAIAVERVRRNRRSVGYKIQFPLESVLDVPEGFDGLKGFLKHVEEAVERIIVEQNARADAEPYDQEEGPGIESYRATLFKETLPRTLRYSALLLMYAAL